jgi:hypothetical protein
MPIVPVVEATKSTSVYEVIDDLRSTEASSEYVCESSDEDFEDVT